MYIKLLITVSAIALIVLITVVFVPRSERIDIVIPSPPGSVVTPDEPAVKQLSPAVALDEQRLSQQLVVDPNCKGFIPEPCGPVLISGTASNLNSITVALADQSYSESTDFSTVFRASRTLDTPSVEEIKTVSTQSGSWTTTFKWTFVGEYRVLIYDTNTKALLLDKSIVVVK
ncbi:hypothetical protein HY478_01025 [Candidatus Uhrbacteria bacterium]|nr:hypothetical protein [Candidatus Uhrbacteria bacterium]